MGLFSEAPGDLLMFTISKKGGGQLIKHIAPMALHHRAGRLFSP